MTRLLGCVLALALASGSVHGQVPQASAAALGMGLNATASPRGFAAVANNPAGLGLPDSPGFTMAIPAVSVDVGLGPVRFSDLVDYEDVLVPASLKEEWLEGILAAGGQRGTVEAGATPLAISVGPIGFQLSALVGGRMSLSPDAAELLLYGNAGRTGSPKDFALDGSTLDGFILSTAAVSAGLPVSEHLAVGVTGKYTVGNALVMGRDADSFFSADPLSVELDFPVLLSPTEDADFNQGSGVGLDVGAIWTGPSVTVGATIQNVFHTFEWNSDELNFVPGQAFFDQDSSSSDFDEQPASGAPRSLLDAAGDLTLKPVFSAGVEFSAGSVIRIQADLRKRVSGGIELGPDFHAGVGAELSALSFLPLRAHLAAVSGGVQIGGGASLVLGPVQLGAALAHRTNEINDATLAMFTLSFGGG